MNMADMEIIKTTPFSHDGKDYEIQLFSDGFNILAKAFIGGKPANGYSHSVTLPVAMDMKNQLGFDAIKALIQDAQRDIQEGYWEKLVEFFKEEEERRKQTSH